MNRGLNEDFDWQCCPEVARLVAKRVEEAVSEVRFSSCLRQRMKDETGTRFMDWVDHICLPLNDPFAGRVEALGYVCTEHGLEQEVWRHPEAMVPAIRLREQATVDVWLKVESVAEFLHVHDVNDGSFEDNPASFVQTAIAASEANSRLAVIERHGTSDFQWVTELGDEVAGIKDALAEHRHAFFSRKRTFADADSEYSETAGFEHALSLLGAAIQDIGTNRACDLFFESERSYWESRNHAARVQKKRQDKLGLGWANHDHHTYRSTLPLLRP